MMKSSTLTTYDSLDFLLPRTEPHSVSRFSYVMYSTFCPVWVFKPSSSYFLICPKWPSVVIFSTSKLTLLDPTTNLAIISWTVRLCDPIPSQPMTWSGLIGSSGIFTEMSQLPHPRLPLVSPRSSNRILGLEFKIGR